MRKALACAIVLSLLNVSVSLAAGRGKSARYSGGTVAEFKDVVGGKWDLEDVQIIFTPEKKELPKLIIPYEKIETLEFGQKVGRRVGAALAGAMIVSPVFLLFLFSHKKKHFLTIGFKDTDGRPQGAVFELAKGIVAESIGILETKTGKKVEYETDEARKSVEKEKK
ncbi:MAG: hypothetical protein HY046_00800 [Acidobacteria bacterium]|nr:hypothetical protein [Acidobacteriota bacterium]